MKNYNREGKSDLLVSAVSICLTVLLLAVFIPDAAPSRADHPPPYPPTLDSPPDGTTGITDNEVVLSWIGVTNDRGSNNGDMVSRYYEDPVDHETIDNYWLKVSTQAPPNSDNASANIVDEEMGDTTSRIIQVNRSTTYYWAVKAHDNDGWSPWATAYFETNWPPVAEILSVSPSPARYGQTVTFEGFGSDEDGDAISDYLWESDLDGKLGTGKDLVYPSTGGQLLSVGDHQISLRVEDQNEVWSEPVIFNLSVGENQAPGKVDSLLTKETHDLQPEIRWAEVTDPEGDDFEYHISVGTDQTMPNDIVNDVKTEEAKYKFSRKLEYGEGGEPNEYYVTIYVQDELGAKSPETKHTLSVINHLPTAPALEITPERAYSIYPLRVSLVEGSNDEDGEDIQWPDDYEISWYKDNGKGAGMIKQTSLDGQEDVESKNTQPGEIWRVEAVPFDGIEYGEMGFDEIAILNLEPEVEISEPEDADEDKDGEWDDKNEDGVPNVYYYTTDAITFDASGTVDEDGQALDFEWDFGNNDTAQGDVVEYRYLVPGVYDVVLTVSDGFNETTVSLMVVIWLPPPELTMEIVGPSNLQVEGGDEGEEIEITVKVTNIGESSLMGAKVRFYDVTGNLSAEIPLGEIKAGDQQLVPASIYVNKAGTVKVEVVDKDGEDLTDPVTITVGARDGEPPEEEGGGILSFLELNDRNLIFLAIILLLIVLVAVYLNKRRREDEYEEDEEEEDIKRPRGYGPRSFMPPGGNMPPIPPGPGMGLGLPSAPAQSKKEELPSSPSKARELPPARVGPEKGKPKEDEIVPKPIPGKKLEAEVKKETEKEGQMNKKVEAMEGEKDGAKKEETLCPHCGEPVEDDWIICIHCRERL